MENIIDSYYHDLEINSRPASVLLRFLRECTEIESRDFAFMNRLIKLYGRYNVFFGIADMTVMNNKIDNWQTLLVFFINKRMKELYTSKEIEDLSPLITEIAKAYDKKGKGKITHVKGPEEE